MEETMVLLSREEALAARGGAEDPWDENKVAQPIEGDAGHPWDDLT